MTEYTLNINEYPAWRDRAFLSLHLWAGFFIGDIKMPFKKSDVPHNWVNLVNKKFGRLLVIQRSNNDKYNGATWLCLCDCNKTIIVSTHNLKNGNTQSCGCLFKENLIKRNTTHKSTGTPLWIVWNGIKNRCLDSKSSRYYRYGERGITLCDEWLDFINFKQWAIENGYKKGLTIERINNNDNYHPLNCKWITHAEQMINTSKSKRWIIEGKEYLSCSQAAKEIGKSYSVIWKWCTYKINNCFCYNLY